MAITTNSKAFLSSPVTQKIVNDIYYGRVVFTVSAGRGLLADNYKHKAIEIYDSRASPILDHYRYVPSLKLYCADTRYRLKVPFYGAILEFLNFGVLVLTFILCLSSASSNPLLSHNLTSSIPFSSSF
jgi:hypothetical protein